MPDLPKVVNPETLRQFTAEAEECDEAEKALLDATTGSGETGKSGVLDSLPPVKMEIRVAKFMAKILTRQERWKKMRFGVLVGPAAFLVGFLVLVIGIIAIPAPGPGWLIVFMGLGILSLEVPRARALVLLTARFFDRCEAWYRGLSGVMRVLVAAVTAVVIAAVFFALYHFMAPGNWPLTRG